MEKLLLVLVVLAVAHCVNCTEMTGAPPPGDATGNWSIAIDRDVICFGSMFVTQLPDGGLVGTFNCGPVKGVISGAVDKSTVHMDLSAVFPDGRDVTMPAVVGIDADGMAMHGGINYPFQPGVPFAARRPFSF